MKRSLQRKKEEPLHKWLDRVTEDILFHCSDMNNYRPVLRDILGEISKESYDVRHNKERVNYENQNIQENTHT